VEGGAVRVAVDDQGLAWVVNDGNQVFRGERRDGGWTLLPGSAVDLGIGVGGTPTFAISATPAAGGFDVVYWDLTTWQSLGRGGVRIAAGPDGSPYIVDNANNIFAFRWNTGIWEQIPGSALDIGVGADGSVWVVRADATRRGSSVAR